MIARGTSDELKAHVGGSRLELVIESAGQALPQAAEIMRKVGDGTDPSVNEADRSVAVPVSEGAGVLAEVVRNSTQPESQSTTWRFVARPSTTSSCV